MSPIEDMIRRIVREEISRITPANDQSPAEFLSVKEAGAHARVSVYSIRRWIRQGELTKHTAGSKLLVKRDELDKLLACEVVSIKNLSIEERVKRRFG